MDANIVPSKESQAEYRGGGNVTDRMEYEGFHSREVAPGIHMMGGCFVGTIGGDAFHSHVTAYLILGSSGSMMIDTGHPKDWPNIRNYVRSVVGDDLDWIFPTHEEYPHSGNIGSLLSEFPRAVAVGDVRNFHLYYPQHEKRFRTRKAHERIDLGGREVVALPAIIHDLPTSMWAYDTAAQMMFVSDAFAYSHEFKNQCTMYSTELPTPPSKAETGLVLDRALYWARFSDSTSLIHEVHQLLKDYPVRMIGPAHGNVVTNPVEITRIMDDALIAARLPPS